MRMASCSRRVDAGFIVPLLLLAATAAQADEPFQGAESERDVLARIVHELRLIETLVTKAQQRKRTEARVSFDYKQLKFELNTVSEGIEEYISGTRLQPRIFAPLRAEYTQVNTQAGEGQEK